jgi:hypothetical protein
MALAYVLFGHPQRLNLLIAAWIGAISRATYFLTCIAFFAVLSSGGRVIALRAIERLSTSAQRHQGGLWCILSFFSCLITAAIFASQLNWSHLPLRYLVAMFGGAALFSGLLSKQFRVVNVVAFIPILAAPVLATLLICMPQPDVISLGLFIIAFVFLSRLFLRVLNDDPHFEMTAGCYNVSLCSALLTMILVYALVCTNVSNWSAQRDELALHWGVFISGAESLLLHLTPFYQFPIQYGLGPALAVFVFCSSDGNCWLGLYKLLVFLYPLYLLLLYRAYRLSFPGTQVSISLLLWLLSFASIFFWSSAGPAQVLMIPSTGPLRFLPLLTLLLLLQSGRHRASYMLFAVNIWWSFDMAIMSAMCLFSYECVRLDFGRAALRLGAVAAGAVGLGAASIWILSGYFPNPSVYLEYLLHMPGRNDPEFFGTVWAFIVALGVSMAVVMAPQSTSDLQLSAAIASTALATLLYYLSRSISVNIDNLMPFIVLLWVRAAWLYRDRKAWRISCAVFFGLVLAGTVLPRLSTNPKFRLSHDIGSFFAEEQGRDNALVARVDTAHFGVILVPKDQAPPRTSRPRWGLIDSWGEWFPVPAARQQLYTKRSLEKMPDQRPTGCMVVYKEYSSLVKGYESAFDVISRRMQGEYLLYGLRRKGESGPEGPDPCAASAFHLG